MFWPRVLVAAALSAAGVLSGLFVYDYYCCAHAAALCVLPFVCGLVLTRQHYPAVLLMNLGVIAGGGIRHYWAFAGAFADDRSWPVIGILAVLATVGSALFFPSSYIRDIDWSGGER